MCVCVCVCVCVCLQTPSAQAGCDTIFKWRLTGLNSDFPFP